MSADRRNPLDAVARVRRVREQDSVAGLRMAAREVEQAQSHLAGLERSLAQHSAVDATMQTFAVRRDGLLVLGQAIVAARTDLEGARTIAVSAREHWQRDHTRLRAIEMLQVRRAEQARTEALRAEAREADERAAVRWSRRDRTEETR